MKDTEYDLSASNIYFQESKSKISKKNFVVSFINFNLNHQHGGGRIDVVHSEQECMTEILQLSFI